jgi:glycosyltransferase involved in cell wall biosynthesis
MVIQRFRPSFGGQGIQVESLCAALSRRGIAPTVYTANPGDAPSTEELDGYRVTRVRTDLRGKSPHWPAFGIRVNRALRRARPDLVHVHGVTDALYGSWLYCRTAARPLVFEMTLLGVDEPGAVDAGTARLRWLRRRLYRQADAYVAMSRAFEPSYMASGLSPDRFHVIPQGVDTARFAAVDATRRTATRTALELPDDAPVVAFAGSLIERKGIDVLLRAWSRVRASHPEAHLVLVGPGDFSEPAAAAAFAALDTGDRASLHRLGQRDDVEVVLGAADVFAFPSRREGFGTVIIEAMAAGLPTVVAELPGISNFIFEHPGDANTAAEADGIVVPQDSPEELAAGISALLADPALRRAIGARGRARAVSAFEMESVADRYQALYDDLVAGKR